MIRSIAITGAGSPIGRALSQELYKKPHFEILKIRSGEVNNQSLFANILKPDTAVTVFNNSQPETVIHLSHAPLNLFDGNIETYKSRNLEFAIKLFENAALSGCKRFIFASSASIYGDKYHGNITESSLIKPGSFYAESKAEIEEALQIAATDTDMNYSSIRIFNVYGSGLRNSFINKLATAMQLGEGKEVTMLGPDNFIRDYINVADIAHSLGKLVNLSTPLPICINLGTGVATSNRDLLNLMPPSFRNQIQLTSNAFSSSVADNSLLESLIGATPFSKVQTMLT